MNQIEQLTDQIVAFRDERDWKQFHNPKDMALSLTLEAAEVLEHFQWKTPGEIEEYLTAHKNELAEELCDVLFWVLLMSRDLGIDLPTAFQAKLAKNRQKYPVEKARGSHLKYTEL